MNDHRDERKWEIMRGSWRGMRARGPERKGEGGGEQGRNKGRRREKMRSDDE